MQLNGLREALPVSDTGKLLLIVLTLGYVISIIVPSAPWLLALVPGRCAAECDSNPDQRRCRARASELKREVFISLNHILSLSQDCAVLLERDNRRVLRGALHQRVLIDANIHFCVLHAVPWLFSADAPSPDRLDLFTSPPPNRSSC